MVNRIRFEELIDAIYSGEYQELEVAIDELYEKWDISKQTGEPLKEIAKIIGLKDLPTDPEILRAFIYSQIGANTSTGTFNDIYTIFNGLMTVLGGTNNIIIEEPPFQIKLFTDATIPTDLIDNIIDILKPAVAVCVNLAGIAIYSDGTYFRYDSSLTAEAYDNSKYNDFIAT